MRTNKALAGIGAVVALAFAAGCHHKEAVPDAGPPSFACGTGMCSGQEYCVGFTEAAGDDNLRCMALPPACTAAPTCACLGRPGNDPGVTCTDDKGQVQVRYVRPGAAASASAAPEPIFSVDSGAPPPEASFPCGDRRCSRTEFCETFAPSTPKPGKKGKPPKPPHQPGCHALPAKCADTPSCGCLGFAGKPFVTCNDANGQVWVAHVTP